MHVPSQDQVQKKPLNVGAVFPDIIDTLKEGAVQKTSEDLDREFRKVISDMSWKSDNEIETKVAQTQWQSAHADWPLPEYGSSWAITRIVNLANTANRIDAIPTSLLTSNL